MEQRKPPQYEPSRIDRQGIDGKKAQKPWDQSKLLPIRWLAVGGVAYRPQLASIGITLTVDPLLLEEATEASEPLLKLPLLHLTSSLGHA